MFADEELVMELLVNAGQARSDAMEAIRCAGQKDWQGATQLMASSESACLQAHKIQTALIILKSIIISSSYRTGGKNQAWSSFLNEIMSLAKSWHNIAFIK